VNLLLKEVQIPTLQSVPFNTYPKIATALENLQVYGCDGIEARIRDTLVELISTAIRFLLEIRHLKVLDQQSMIASASSSSFSAASTPTTTTTTTTTTSAAAIDYSKLTEEEKYILDAEKESERRRNDILLAITKGRPKVLESISKRVRSKYIVIRFLKPMEQFMGVDMKRYGPFRQEDVAVLPFENARSLIENNHAMEVQSIY
jgi:DNA replication initiation complex subunit (GINS family)